MSILLASSLPTTSPVAAVTVPPGDQTPLWLLLICLAWAAAGLAVAALLGAFRRQSVVGPQRLTADESAWDLLVVFFTAYFAGIMVFAGVFNFLHKPAGAVLLLLQAVVGLVIFSAGLILLRLLRPDAMTSVGLRLRQLGSGLAGGAVTLFVIYPLIMLTSAGVEWIDTLLHHKVEPHEILQFLSSTRDRRLAIIAIFLAVVVAPLNEELLFRGLLQTIFTRLFGWLTAALRSTTSHPVVPTGQINVWPTAPVGATAGNRWSAIVTTSLIFALYHGEPAVFAPIFVLAVALGYIYERTGNLWMTITTHAMFNAAQIWLFLQSRN